MSTLFCNPEFRRCFKYFTNRNAVSGVIERLPKMISLPPNNHNLI